MIVYIDREAVNGAQQYKRLHKKWYFYTKKILKFNMLKGTHTQLRKREQGVKEQF